MAMNPRLLRPLALPRLLDFAPGAAAAYSLRQLSSSYAGPVVTVRRSSDSAEADFTAGQVNDGTLAAWVGSGNDGFVKTWHDQSGNNRDASQATSANQPKIVSSGSLITKNSRPAISFDGTTFLSAASALTAQSGVAFCVFDSTGGQFRVSQSNPAADNAVFSLDSTTVVPTYARHLEITPSASNIFAGTLKSLSSKVSLVAYFSNGTAWSLRTDGAAEVLSGASGTNTGAWFGDYQFPLFIQRLNRVNSLTTASDNLEIVIYNGDQSSLVQRIEGDINRHYRIF